MARIEAETATGLQAFDAEQGRKLVLAIEDAGVDILHRCGGNAKCTTCRAGAYLSSTAGLPRSPSAAAIRPP